MNHQYYFAYGSNLNARDLAKWAAEEQASIPKLVPVCTAFLPDRALVFPRYSQRRKGGVLGYTDSPGSVVEGVVFKVKSEAHWQLLDRKEGAGKSKSYFKVLVDLIDEQGNLLKAWTYQANSESPPKHYQPSQDYYQVVEQGLKDYGLSTDSLKAAAEYQPPHVESNFFFYGTLMRGQPRFDCLRQFNVTCCLLAQTPGVLLDLGAYPGMIPTVGSEQLVQGEFICLNDARAALKALDQIEGFRGYSQTGSLFQRTLIRVHVGDHRFRRAWTYQLAEPRPDRQLIPSGDWREHLGSRREFLSMLAQLHTLTGEMKDAAPASAPDLGVLGLPLNCESNPSDPHIVCENLINHRISERLLAQHSKNWTAGCR